MEKRICPECGDTYEGRRDKKFCCDQCRTGYFNRINSDQNKYMRDVNNILRKNRRILAHVLHQKNQVVQGVTLLEEGFRFSYFTHEQLHEMGSVMRYCYEYGYCKVDEDLYVLSVRR
jgi:hypothetical protein